MTAQVQARKNIHREMESAAAGRAVTSFILGIVSTVCCVVPIMLVAAVVGLLLERESERMGEHPLQTPARVLCIVGIVLCSIAILVILALVFVAGVVSRGV